MSPPITPEHLHVTVNHIPLIGLAFACVPLLFALIAKQRSVLWVGLIMVLLGGAQEGHGEYWHSFFETSMDLAETPYVTCLDRNIEYDTFRNVDNMALLDENWLVIFGNGIKNKLTVSMEVSKRPNGPAGAGGGFVISKKQPAQMEDDVTKISTEKFKFNRQEDEAKNNPNGDNPTPTNNATGIIKFPEALQSAYGVSIDTRDNNQLLAIGKKGRSGFNMVPTFKVVKNKDGNPIGTILFETRCWDIWRGNENWFGLARVASTVDIDEGAVSDKSLVRFDPLKVKNDYMVESLQTARQAIVKRAYSGELLSDSFIKSAGSERLASNTNFNAEFRGRVMIQDEVYTSGLEGFAKDDAKTFTAIQTKIDELGSVSVSSHLNLGSSL